MRCRFSGRNFAYAPAFRVKYGPFYKVALPNACHQLEHCTFRMQATLYECTLHPNTTWNTVVCLTEGGEYGSGLRMTLFVDGAQQAVSQDNVRSVATVYLHCNHMPLIGTDQLSSAATGDSQGH